MKLYTILTSTLLAVSVLLSSCQTPPPAKFDRQLNAVKFRAGGFNPGTRDPRHPNR